MPLKHLTWYLKHNRNKHMWVLFCLLNLFKGSIVSPPNNLLNEALQDHFHLSYKQAGPQKPPRPSPAFPVLTRALSQADWLPRWSGAGRFSPLSLYSSIYYIQKRSLLTFTRWNLCKPLGPLRCSLPSWSLLWFSRSQLCLHWAPHTS